MLSRHRQHRHLRKLLEQQRAELHAHLDLLREEVALLNKRMDAWTEEAAAKGSRAGRGSGMMWGAIAAAVATGAFNVLVALIGG